MALKFYLLTIEASAPPINCGLSAKNYDFILDLQF